MTITPALFGAFLKCRTKCWLRSINVPRSGNTYSEWVQSQNESFRASQTGRLLAETPLGESAQSPTPENLKVSTWRLAVDVVARTPELFRSSRRGEAHTPVSQPSNPGSSPSGQSLVSSAATVQPAGPQPALVAESNLHAVERVSSEGRGNAAQFMPIRFVFTTKLGKHDKLLLAFDAFVLSAALGGEIAFGKIVHGDGHATLKVRTSSLAGEVWKRIEKIAALLSTPDPPDLVLNRHCPECEFQARCRQKALEKDDLSLLTGMNEKARKKLHSKGIFTVTQLSYTFRVRRKCKRWKSQQPDYSHALKALAIRENKVHVIGRQKLELDGTPVYLDVEGTDDGLYYLIGCRVNAQQRSFWAEDRFHERIALEGFLEFLASVPSPKLVFYGRYERRFLTTMHQRYDDLFARFPTIENLLQNSLNLVSVVYSKIYFPCYGNTLKELARHLGFAWTSAGASGLQALGWRAEWESTKDEHLMRTLLQYNAEDCQALEVVSDFVNKLCREEGISAPTSDCIRVEELKTDGRFLINKGAGALPEFKAINAAAYWDYQRVRVYARTSKVIKKASRSRNVSGNSHLVRGPVANPRPTQCPKCGDKDLMPHAGGGRSLVHDIKFVRHGAKAWVTSRTSEQCYCPRCQLVVGPPLDHPFFLCKYGPKLRAYGVDQLIRLNIPGATVAKSLGGLFHYDLDGEHLSQWKADFAELYADMIVELTARITKGPLIHADETAARVVGKSAVVWVLASMEDVVFLYAESREGEMIHELLREFRGVLVSDFYAAYDSFDCPQQKCLIHLIRDFNDDLHRYPFDSELRQIASKFTSVLKLIVETIDQRGLKARFLAKHQFSVRKFLTWVIAQDFESEIAQKYGQRFRKNQGKLFTFMKHDGVPWNNNNAENAIRAFAALRERIAGHCTEKSLRHHLILLSISETCKRRGLSFFDFLCSGEKSLEGFAASEASRRRARRSGSAKALEKKNDHEDDGNAPTSQRTVRPALQDQAVPVMPGHVPSPSPWNRFRPSAAGEVTQITKRPLNLNRFDHVPFDGIVSAIPALMVSGLWEGASELFPEWVDRPFVENALLLIASMLLSPRGKMEEIERAWPTNWSEVFCRIRLPDTRSLVDLINLIGRNPVAVAKWQSALAAKWVSDGSRFRAILVDRGQTRVLLEEPAVLSGNGRARDLLRARGLVEQWFRILDGAPMLLLTQSPSDEVLAAWKEWILLQIPGLSHVQAGKHGGASGSTPAPPTVVVEAGSLELRLIRKLRRAGLHFLTYRLSAAGLWPGGELTKQEVELWPGHRESMETAERDVSMTFGPPMREALCILRNGLHVTIISSNHELNLRRIGARLAFEFTATRFLDRRQKILTIVRSYEPQQRAGEAAELKVGAMIDSLVSSAALVVFRAEAILEQILREKLPRPMESAMALRNILCGRIDLLPIQGVNILKVLIYTTGDVSEQAVIEHLCSQLTAAEVSFPGTNLRLVYELVTHEG